MASPPLSWRTKGPSEALANTPAGALAWSAPASSYSGDNIALVVQTTRTSSSSRSTSADTSISPPFAHQANSARVIARGVLLHLPIDPKPLSSLSIPAPGPPYRIAQSRTNGSPDRSARAILAPRMSFSLSQCLIGRRRRGERCSECAIASTHRRRPYPPL